MSGDQLYVQTDGVLSYSQIHDQVAAGLSQLTGAAAPEAAGVQTTHGTIAVGGEHRPVQRARVAPGHDADDRDLGHHDLRAPAEGRPDVPAGRSAGRRKAQGRSRSPRGTTGCRRGRVRRGERARGRRRRPVGHERGSSGGEMVGQMVGQAGRMIGAADAAAAGSRPGLQQIPQQVMQGVQQAVQAGSQSVRVGRHPIDDKPGDQRNPGSRPTTMRPPPRTTRPPPTTTHPAARTRRIHEQRTGARHLRRPAPAQTRPQDRPTPL